MSRIPVATELGRKDRVWPAVTASIAVHAAAIALALHASSGPAIELEQTPIKAKLVRLGEKKPEAQLPRKDVPPPPPEQAPAAPAPPQAAPPPPPDTPPPPAAMPAPTPAPAPPARAAPARQAPARSRANGGGVDALLARTERELQQEKLYGDPEGDPDGDSEEGSAGDRYEALVSKAVHANYQVPSTIPDRERLHLEAYMTIWVEADGTISRFEITKPSGNPAFDAALDRAIRATRLPPPPSDWAQQFRRRGRTLKFKI
ncbi:MAG TPA: energy transducer TonB [Anaeromyxobacter sp.]|nr:energy transducer TonB [Anaeromyxobacter sp.]